MINSTVAKSIRARQEVKASLNQLSERRKRAENHPASIGIDKPAARVIHLKHKEMGRELLILNRINNYIINKVATVVARLYT